MSGSVSGSPRRGHRKQAWPWFINSVWWRSYVDPSMHAWFGEHEDQMTTTQSGAGRGTCLLACFAVQLLRSMHTLNATMYTVRVGRHHQSSSDQMLRTTGTKAVKLKLLDRSVACLRRFLGTRFRSVSGAQRGMQQCRRREASLPPRELFHYH